MSECPFCGRDPFHYVDNGVGMEAVAVTCCELGDAFYRGMRPAPEEVTLSWEEFHEVGSKIASLRAQLDAANKSERLTFEISARLLKERDESRAQLAGASERVAEMQAEAGMYHSLYDVATERLASARKALEEIDSLEPGSRAAYSKFAAAKSIAKAALTSAYRKGDSE